MPSVRYDAGVMERRIDVNVVNGAYAIIVRAGVLADVGQLLAVKKALVLTDSQVGPIHFESLRASLHRAGCAVSRAEIPAGEAHKLIETLLPVYDTFLAARMERNTPVIALGGGMVGDMAGFVAATLLRGVPFVQVPTSLLAMVDASVGGKTGINHAAGKNLIGAFHQPIAVFIDPQVLLTLPPRELRSGLAECIKHDLIRDAEEFAKLEHDIEKALSLDLEYLTELVAHNVAIKARVVEADPFEKGERAHLNFGHTFGHAIEKVTHFEISHGEAVAIGMCAAAALAQELGMLAASDRRRIEALIQRAGLPCRAPGLSIDAAMEAMAYDKKVSAGRVRFVLPERIGRVVIREDVEASAVRAAWRSVT